MRHMSTAPPHLLAALRVEPLQSICARVLMHRRHKFLDGRVHETTHTRSVANSDEADIRRLRRYLGQE